MERDESLKQVPVTSYVDYQDWLADMLNPAAPDIPLPDMKLFKADGSQAPTVLLASYPRSGNTLSRGLIEKPMGIFTKHRNKDLK